MFQKIFIKQAEHYKFNVIGLDEGGMNFDVSMNVSMHVKKDERS